MPFNPVEIEFGPRPSREPLYAFMRDVDETCLRRIALADYGHGENEVFALLVETLHTGELPIDHKDFLEFEECVTLTSLDRDESPLIQFVSLSLLFDLEAKDALLCPIDHDNNLARLVTAALDHSPAAATALAPFVSWLSLNEPTCRARSFHVLALILLLFSKEPDSIGSAEITFLERVFDDELRRSASEVIGYDNECLGYDDALGMIADGERIWLLCLDTSTRNHRPWTRLVDRVLKGRSGEAQIEGLRRRICGGVGFNA